MDANGTATGVAMGKTIWDVTDLEATARDLVDVGIWEVAVQEEQKKTAQESAEAQYNAARSCLTQSQAKHTRAICEFMEKQARWKTATSQIPGAVPHPVNTTNPLEAAETELRRARCLYCMVLEQNQLLQHLLRYTRDAFHQAHENVQRLAVLCESTSE